MKNPLRILMISQYGQGLSNPEAQFSGALDRQKDYAKTLEAYHLIVPAATDSEAPIEAGGGLVIHPVRAGGTVSFLRAAAQRAAALHATHHYHAFMVDNPHIGGLLGMYLKRKLKLPWVLHSMADMIQNPWYRKERWVNHLKSWCIELSVRSADVIRVSTNAELVRLKHTTFAHKLHKVSFYVDQANIKQTLATAPEPATHTSINFLFVGRLGHQKDLSTLLDAFALMHRDQPETRLTLVGGGPLEYALKAKAHALSVTDAVTFTGPVPYEQVIAQYKAADVFVISSLYEGTCMVLHEAGLAGLPVVATDFAGARDLIEDGVTGYLSPVRDAHALAEGMKRILANPGAASAMAHALTAAVECVNREYALAEWDALCQKLHALSTARAV